MSYLRTVVTYHQPSEAEVDKAFLESHGVNVCLLNDNTGRNEFGPAFYIQLQVPQEEYATAVALLKEVNPTRFGSAERVAEIEKEMLRGVAWFFLPAAVFAVIGFFATPESSFDNFRLASALAWGGLAGLTAIGIRKFRNRQRAKESPHADDTNRR